MTPYNPLLEKWSKTKDCNSVATLVSRSFGAFWLHLFGPLRNLGYNHIKAFYI